MTISEPIQQAIQAYYAERPTSEDIAALEAWFREDEAHVKIFAEHGMLEWQMLCEQEKQDAAAILSILREAEDKAEPDFSLLHAPVFLSDSDQSDKKTITFGSLCSLAGYAAAKGMRTKFGVIGSIAALLVIGGLLSIVLFGSGGTPESPDLANTPSEPDRVGPNTPATNPIVATLTAERDAIWDRRPGEDLYVGQRFNLTAGFAEITTKRGAVAILEAPATIELLDNDNALQLHSGKLVGICETDSSKGFLVRAPHMNVIDLGTRFGVDTTTGQTQVHVFEGEVSAQLVRGGKLTGDPVTVRAFQSIAGAPRSIALSALSQADSSAFATTGRVEIFVANTGQRLVGEGQTDTKWFVTQINGKPLDQPAATRLFTPPARVSTRPDLRFHANTPEQLGWITIDPAVSSSSEISYTYQTRFDSGDLEPASLKLDLRFRADNFVSEIRLNGRSVHVPEHTRRPPFDTLVLSRIDKGFVAGENILEVEIRNVRHAGEKNEEQNHSALIAELILTGQVVDWRQIPSRNPAVP